MLSAKAIVNLQKLVRSVPVGDYVLDYVARLVRATRPKDPTAPDFVSKMVDWGAGPRAGQFLIHGGKAMAAMDGRFSVAIDDIKKVAIPVLRHRVSTNFQAQAEGKTSEDIIEQLLLLVGEPEVAKYERRREAQSLMSRWFRVFGTSDSAARAGGMLEHLRELGGESRGRVSRGRPGLVPGGIELGAGQRPLQLERYLASRRRDPRRVEYLGRLDRDV